MSELILASASPHTNQVDREVTERVAEFGDDALPVLWQVWETEPDPQIAALGDTEQQEAGKQRQADENDFPEMRQSQADETDVG